MTETKLTKTEILNAAEHWERIADDEERLAAWDRKQGVDMSFPGQSPGDHRASAFRATAKALRLEAETGKPHCSVCFQDHPNHLHMHRG